MDEIISFPLIGLTVNPSRYLSLFGFPIYYYGLLIAAGYLLAAFYAYKRRNDFCLNSDRVLDILLITVIAGIVGARIYYIVFNARDYFTRGNLLQIFNIRNGGLAVYGGLIAASASIVFYCRSKKLSVLKTFDVLGIAVPIGQAIGRWGNFINREAHGSETSVPWKMGFTDINGVTRYYHPTFLYESLWNIIGLCLMHLYSKKAKKRKDGELILMYTAWYGFGRFFIESLRTDSLYLGSLRISQGVAAITFCAAVCLITLLKRGKPGNKSIPETASSDIFSKSSTEATESEEDSLE